MHDLRAGPEHAGHGVDTGAQGRIHQVRIALGRLHLAVAQQLADHFQRRTAADQQGGEGVAQVVDPHLGKSGLFLHVDPEAADFLDRLARHIAGKKPRVALWHHQLALAHNGGDLGRDRNAVDLALLGGGGGL